MTLTEFLLARIAEDEYLAERAGSFDGPAMRNDNYGCLNIQPARVLAECEAKRAIVERCAAILVNPCGDYSADFAADEILAALASVYVDHADYCEEWRRDTP